MKRCVFRDSKPDWCIEHDRFVLDCVWALYDLIDALKISQDELDRLFEDSYCSSGTRSASREAS